MTLTEIVELVSRRLGSPRELAWGFVQETVEVIVEALNRGEEVRIRGLGRLHWVKVKGRPVSNFSGGQAYVSEGWKLRFTPATQFKSRRTEMSEEGITKLGVVLDDEKTKTANEGGATPACPVCLKELDGAGACPEHGTEPLEPTGGGGGDAA